MPIAPSHLRLVPHCGQIGPRDGPPRSTRVRAYVTATFGTIRGKGGARSAFGAGAPGAHPRARIFLP